MPDMSSFDCVFWLFCFAFVVSLLRSTVFEGNIFWPTVIECLTATSGVSQEVSCVSFQSKTIFYTFGQDLNNEFFFNVSQHVKLTCIEVSFLIISVLIVSYLIVIIFTYIFFPELVIEL